MPFHLHIPLPGPFSYSKRIGGGRSKAGPVIYWLSIGWWLVPSWLICKWTVLGIVWLCRLPLSRRSTGAHTARGSLSEETQVIRPVILGQHSTPVDDG